MLAEEVIARARKAGIDKLYLQTDNLSGGLYSRLGFKPLYETEFGGHHVLVMVLDLKS